MNTLINVTQSSMPPLEEYIREISPLWESRWLTNAGEKHEELTRQLAEYLGVEHIALFSSGHMALELSIQALGLTGEVITTPFTFASTTHAIVRNGLTPVFCDINPEDYTLDPEQLERRITAKTSAILPVHVYGNLCDVDAIERIARKHGLKVIYDAAHTFGASLEGRSLASYGDLSVLSFHATKVFHSVEGGAAVYHTSEVGERLCQLRNFGLAGPEQAALVGTNAKLSEFHAAMGICNLRHVEAEIAKRRIVFERYRERLQNLEGITLRRIQPGVRSNYAYFPIFIDPKAFGRSRDEVCEQLGAAGFHARKYFYPLTSAFSCYQCNPSETPTALKLSQRVLTLPMYGELPLECVDKICDVIGGLR